MNKFESASIIAGLFPNSEEQATAPTNVHMITGEVVERSEDGKALINMDGVVFSGDDSQYVEVDALGGLEEGDTAAILLSGETGKAMAPFALGSAGIIDRVRTTAEDADTLAGEAWEVAEAVGQHVWTDDDGLHVTEIPKEEFIVNPTGANQLMNANGTLICDGEIYRTASTPSGYAIYDGEGNNASNIAAQFSADSQRIGKEDDSHIKLFFNEIRMVDSNGNTYMLVKDMRNKNGITDDITETFYGDGTNKTFRLGLTAVDPDYTVTKNGQPVTEFEYKIITQFILPEAPDKNDVIEVTYRTSDHYAKYFNIGFRRSGYVGPLSTVIGEPGLASGFGSVSMCGGLAYGRHSLASGYLCQAKGEYAYAEGISSQAIGNASHSEGHISIANGNASHSEGYYTKANGAYSHAQNWHTTASGEAQTAIGKNNIEDTEDEYAFIIGNGRVTVPSNALTVDWDGNIEAGTYNGVDVAQLGSDLTQLDSDVVQLGSDVTQLQSDVESLEPSAMSAQCSTALNLSTTYAKVTLSSSASVGSKLSISSGGIKCSEAGFVRVSAFAHLASMTNAHVGNVQIRKGDTAVAFASNRAVSDRIGLALPERVIEVAANDVIYLYAANTSGAAGQINANYMTYLTVEYI